MTVIAGGIITLEFATSGLQWSGVGQAQNTARDADIATYVQAATPVVEDVAGPVILKTYTHLFNGGVPAIVLPHFAQSIVSVTENGAATTDYQWDSFGQIIYAGVNGQRFWAEGYLRGIAVSYTVGYATPPMQIQLGTRELVRFWYQQGMQANRPAFGDGAPSEPMVATPMGFMIPRRVDAMLRSAPGRKLGGFA